ncbi:MAG TPA: methyl-accepting chemotaxis protein [Opitutaceae bacterium]|nr:methyl-accepting chemotaxis protein [Opitutaceae bacterium]
MRALNLSTTIACAFAAIALTAIAGALAIIGTATWAQRREAQQRVAAAASREATALYAQGLQMGQATRNIILEPENPKAYSNFDAATKDFATVLATLRDSSTKLPDAAAFVSRLDTIERSWKSDEAIHRRIHTLAKSGDSASAVKLLRAEETPLWREYKDVILDVVKTAREMEEVAFAGVNRGRRISFTIYGSVGALLAGTVLAGAWFGWRGMRRANGAFGAMTQVCQRIPEAIAIVAEGAQHGADEAARQAAQLEETSATVAELASQMESADQAARNVASFARATRDGVAEGRRSTEELATTMRKLRESSGEIAKIVQTINGIAFQTNILALNAAVEAARAGEAGAGFAVVAEEVRALALRSATAARETAERIQQAVDGSHAGAALTENVVGALTRIDAQAGELTGQVETLSSSVAEEKKGFDLINRTLQGIDHSVQSTAAQSQQVAAAAQELGSQGGALRSAASTMADIFGFRKHCLHMQAHEERPSAVQRVREFTSVA